jgi:hypothetical protein
MREAPKWGISHPDVAVDPNPYGVFFQNTFPSFNGRVGVDLSYSDNELPLVGVTSVKPDPLFHILNSGCLACGVQDRIVKSVPAPSSD